MNADELHARLLEVLKKVGELETSSDVFKGEQIAQLVVKTHKLFPALRALAEELAREMEVTGSSKPRIFLRADPDDPVFRSLSKKLARSRPGGIIPITEEEQAMLRESWNWP